MLRGTVFRRKRTIACGMLLACFLWGSAYSGIKKGYELFAVNASHIPSLFLYIGIRFAVAGLFLAAFSSFSQGKLDLPRKDEAIPIMVTGFVQTALHYILFYIALSRITAVKSAIVSGLKVFLGIFVSALVFRMERYTFRKAFASLLAFAAVLITDVRGGFSFVFDFGGEGVMILSILVASAGTCLQKRWTTLINPVKLCGYQFMAGGVTLFVTGLLFGGKIRLTSPFCVPLMLYLALVSSCGYGIQTTLLKYNDVSDVIVYRSTEPLFGTVISAFVMDEFAELLNVKSCLALTVIVIAILAVSVNSDKSVARGRSC